MPSEILLDRLDPTLKHAITPPAFDKSKLHRADLVDRIHVALDKSLVVIAAPAGYGKTTLLADFTAHTDLSVCWVRIGEGTHDALSLARLVVESLRRVFPKAKRANDANYPATPPPKSVARILGGWIESSFRERFVLILDDIHSLGDQAGTIEFLDEFIQLRPNSMSLVSSGRGVPELSLARLLAEDQLAGFGPNDLALTPNEVDVLTRMVSKEKIDRKGLDQIYEFSKGWVTGVILSGVVAREALGGIAPEGSPLVFDYLSSVVLNRLPEDTRRFVIDVSVLPVMTVELCDDLLQRHDSARILRQCLRKGVFLDSSGGEAPTYAFHALFRTFLVDTFSATDSSRQARLRARGGILLERQGSLEAAFQLFAEAGDLERAGRLAERHAKEAGARGQVEMLQGWWTVLQNAGGVCPELMMTLASAHMDRGDLRSAEELAGISGPWARLRLSREDTARLTNLRAGILYRRGAYDESIKMASAVIRSRDASILPSTRAIAMETKALGLAAKRDRLEEAKRAAETAIEILTAEKDTRGLARALRNLGSVLEAQGDFGGLTAVAERVSSLLKGTGSASDIAYALNNLANVRHKDGRYEESLNLYGEALKNARQAAHSFLEGLILYGQADVFSDAGMALPAAQLYGEGLAIAARIENPFLLRYGCIQTSALYRRRGNLAVSNEWIRRVIEHEEPGSRSGATSVQLAGLELAAAPRNAITSLNRILGESSRGMAGEEEVLANVFLASAYRQVKDDTKCRGAVEKALMSAGSKGAEQIIAAELNANEETRLLFESVSGRSPVLEVVMGRIEAMRSFRRLHPSSPEESAEAGRVRAYALGRARISFEGKPLRGLKRQAREVLYYLVDKKSAGRELLAEMFWSRYPPGRRAANIHTVVHSIRSLLGKASILLEDGVYYLNPSIETQSDVDQFETAAEIAQKLPFGDPRRFFVLNEAISLYTGPFLTELSSAWAVERRRTLEIRYLDLVSELALEALTRDQPQKAVEYLRRGLLVDPLRDDFNLRYLEALGRLGQVSEASQHYQRYTQLVREELGIDPPERIRELYARLIG